MKFNLLIALRIFSLIFLFSLSTTNNTFAKCVYLKPLKIKAMDLGNMLSWTTTEESDLQIFVVQKSTNGIDFKRVGDVKGAGYSQKTTHYRFLDFALPEHNTYYRLLHYSSDGSFTISETFFVEQNANNNWMVASVSSTLTNENLDLTLKSKDQTSIQFEVKNKKGRVIETGSKTITSGINKLSINCKSFANGEYDVILKSGTGVAKITIKKVMGHEMPNLE